MPIGSSIDGPEEITDSQRGTGYYEKCMKGYEIARSHGLSVRFICTFTNKSVKHREEIFSFFKEKGFVLKLHPALPSLRSENPKEWALEPAEYGDLLVYLLDKSLENLGTMEVMNINDLCRCVFTRRGSVCTFVNCMGNTFAIGPDGSIYPCYRFVGMPEWVMGNVRDRPTMERPHAVRARAAHDGVLRVRGYGLQGLLAHQILPGRLPLQRDRSLRRVAGRGGPPLCGLQADLRRAQRADEQGDVRGADAGDGGFGMPSSRKKAKPGVMALMRAVVSK